MLYWAATASNQPQRRGRPELRQRVQPAPDTARRPPLKHHMSLVQRQQRPGPLDGRRAPMTHGGELLDEATGPRRTGPRQRAGGAFRRRPRAHRRAKVHQPLRVGGHVGRRGQQRRCPIPQRSLDACHGDVARHREMACQHPLDVAVENGFARAGTEGGDRRCGRAADARQLRQHRCIEGEPAGETVDHLPRAGVQVARSRVVAETRPQRQHVVQRRRGQRSDIREALAEARVVGDDCRHLRLLQHHLGQPDAVGVATRLPGKVVPAVRRLPGNDPRREAAADATRRHAA